MNKYYEEHVDEVDKHEIEELELFSVAIDYLSFKYDLRHDEPLSYWIDINWGSHYIPILIAFKENRENIFCYSINFFKKGENSTTTIFERQTDSIVELVKDIDGVMTFADNIKLTEEED